MFKKNVVVIVGVPLLVFFLTLGFLNQARGTESVVVASKYIGVGTRVDSSMIVQRQMPKAAVPANAFRDPSKLEGQVVTVSRAPGDLITKGMVGSKAVSALAAGTKPDHRIIAINVDRATGLAGLLQVGDKVSVIGILDPQTMQIQSNQYTYSPLGPGTGKAAEQAEMPLSPEAMVVASGLTVKFVPWTFRYTEGTTEGYQEATTTAQAQESNVILLDVPVEPVPVAPGGPEVSMPELLALLNRYGTLHLVLDPASADYSTPPTGIQAYRLYDFIRQNAPILPLPTGAITGATGSEVRLPVVHPASKAGAKTRTARPTARGKGGKK